MNHSKENEQKSPKFYHSEIIIVTLGKHFSRYLHMHIKKRYNFAQWYLTICAFLS